MLTLLSPAKNLDLDPVTGVEVSAPIFTKDAAVLARLAKTKSAQDLKDLMHISDALAELNVDRFKSFVLSGKSNSAKPAALMFNGDVYGGLDAPSFTKTQLNFAQDNLRILSGLYGMLRPLDALQPYRLEMGTKFENESGKNLYEFWGDKLSKQINADLKGDRDQTVINLASNEYFKAVDKKALDAPVISPRFLEEKDGKARVISFYAKRARGLMARYIVTEKITASDDIYGFNLEGYAYDKAASKPSAPAFSRVQPAPKNG